MASLIMSFSTYNVIFMAVVLAHITWQPIPKAHLVYNDTFNVLLPVQKWQRKWFSLDAIGDLSFFENEKVSDPRPGMGDQMLRTRLPKCLL